MATKSGQQEPEKAEVVEELLDALDTALDRVKVLYEQYFLGIQKQPPSYLHTDVERKIRDIAQLQVRNTALRYRFVTLQQKFGAYNAYWRRTLRQIENGTYTRNLSKIGRHAARTGAAVPEEILAAMPRRMREQVQRDREAALALARLRNQQRADDPDLLTLADEDIEIDLQDLEPAAFIHESSDLRRNVLTARGPYTLDEADADFDLDAFFASVTSDSEPDLEAVTPVMMVRPANAPTALRPPPEPGPTGHPSAELPSAQRTRTRQPGAGRPPAGHPSLEPPSPAEPAAGPSRAGARISPHVRQPPPKGAVTQALPRSPGPLPARATPPVGHSTLAAAPQPADVSTATAAAAGPPMPAPAPEATKPAVPAAPAAFVRPPIPAPAPEATKPAVVAAPAASVRPPMPALTQLMASDMTKPVMPGVPATPPRPSISVATSVAAQPATPEATKPAPGPSSARPLQAAPSQATRPNPVAPGASAVHAPTPVETLAGPFPRIPSIPALPNKQRPSGASARTPPPVPVPASARTPAPEAVPASARTPAPEPVPASARTPAPEAVPASARTPAPEAVPASARTPASERSPSTERPPVPAGLPPRTRSASRQAAQRGAPGARQGPPPGMTDADVNALYATYVKAKQTLGEAADPGAYSKLLKTINSQAPKIMEQYKAKGVDFSVVVKDNQVIIRAKPKP